jgi:hypothetical protein
LQHEYRCVKAHLNDFFCVSAHAVGRNELLFDILADTSFSMPSSVDVRVADYEGAAKGE